MTESSHVVPTVIGIILVIVGVASIVLAAKPVGLETAVLAAGTGLIGWAAGSLKI